VSKCIGYKTLYLKRETHTSTLCLSGGNSDALGVDTQQARLALRYFLWWQVFFTDGTDQTYLAIVHLQVDQREEDGWDDHPTNERKCVDLDA
jgi:hypothetical protein